MNLSDEFQITDKQVDQFVFGYITAALWTEEENINESGVEADRSEVCPDSLKRVEKCCKRLLTEYHDAVRLMAEHIVHSEEYTAWEVLGHNFWLTRNGHGAGFWDKEYRHTAAVKASEYLTLNVGFGTKYPAVDLYVGDDKKIYID